MRVLMTTSLVCWVKEPRNTPCCEGGYTYTSEGQLFFQIRGWVKVQNGSTELAQMILFKNSLRYQWDGSDVKSFSSPYRRPEFDSQHPHSGSQLPVTLVLGDQIPSCDLHRNKANTRWTHTHASLSIHPLKVSKDRKLIRSDLYIGPVRWLSG